MEENGSDAVAGDDDEYEQKRGKSERSAVEEVKHIGDRVLEPAENESGNAEQYAYEFTVFFPDLDADVYEKTAEESVDKNAQRRLCEF